MSHSVSNNDPLVVVTGADENYSIGLAVTVQSMLYHLDAARAVQLYVLDGGIRAETKGRLLKSWADPRMTIQWIDADLESLSHLVTSGHLNHTTYLRLLIPAILPSDCQKALYLDSDLLIRRDVGLLWDEPLEGYSILAGQETGAPYVDAAIVFADQPAKYSKVGITTPVKNYRQLGMNPQAKVFNAGILVINVDHWRQNDVPQLAFDCLEENREHVLYCDQYALNVVLADSWRELDTRWNQTAHFYNYANVRESPFDQTTYDMLRYDPWVCHFTWMYKPWWQGCDHPFADEFVEQMRRTDWEHHALAVNPAVAAAEAEAVARKQMIRLHPNHADITFRRRTWKQWLERRRQKMSARIRRHFPASTGTHTSQRDAA